MSQQVREAEVEWGWKGKADAASVAAKRATARTQCDGHDALTSIQAAKGKLGRCSS